MVCSEIKRNIFTVMYALQCGSCMNELGYSLKFQMVPPRRLKPGLKNK